MRFLPTNQIWRYWSFDTCLRDIEATGTRDIDLWLCNNHVNIDASTCPAWSISIRLPSFLPMSYTALPKV